MASLFIDRVAAVVAGAGEDAADGELRPGRGGGVGSPRSGLSITLDFNQLIRIHLVMQNKLNLNVFRI
jgi:hypothetical protein